MPKWRKNGEVNGEPENKALQQLYKISIIMSKITCRVESDEKSKQSTKLKSDKQMNRNISIKS